ncbi:MAG: hypothetical protein K0U84_21820 [Actinomycetia bacterium]|nr:hypothetical protein [Actinomycetes bacterium]
MSNETGSSTGGSDSAAAPAEDAVDASEPGIEAPGEPVEDAADTVPDGTVDPQDVKWRARFRQAETELTVERARLGELNRREAERLAAVALEDPADLFVGGVELADLLGDDGLIDNQKVDDAVAAVIEAHPHWARRQPVAGVPASKVGVGATPIPAGQQAPSWSALLKGEAG